MASKEIARIKIEKNKEYLFTKLQKAVFFYFHGLVWSVPSRAFFCSNEPYRQIIEKTIQMESKCHFLFFIILLFLLLFFYLIYFYWILEKREKQNDVFFFAQCILCYGLSCFVEPYLSKPLQEPNLLFYLVIQFRLLFLNKISPLFLISIQDS